MLINCIEIIPIFLGEPPHHCQFLLLKPQPQGTCAELQDSFGQELIKMGMIPLFPAIPGYPTNQLLHTYVG